jgi:hypothetical protein
VLSLFLCSLSYLICNLFYPRTVCMIFFWPSPIDLHCIVA